MHIAGHVLSAVPFLFFDLPGVAVGAVLPDITWVRNEIDYRRSSIRPWAAWLKTLPERRIRSYRVAHSFLTVSLLFFISSVSSSGILFQVLLGWGLHLLLDLPTHDGRMRQMPFYPFSWRWPWVLKL